MIVIIGIALKVWNAECRRQLQIAVAWLAACVFLPFFTVATQGFLGYGLAAMSIVYAFATALSAAKVRTMLAAVLVAFLGLSVYVTYMRDRGQIREAVWAGAGFSEASNRIWTALDEFEWFNPYNLDHLARLNGRLNQNFLVGLVVPRVESGFVAFAGGQTITDAALAIVPRALWPDKPMSAGSGNLVSVYTGVPFAEGTSVGIGQVLEFYINFGVWGVIAGFFAFGAVLAAADRMAYDALAAGDVTRFAMWFLPALSFLQVGGSLVEVTATAGASLIMAFGFGSIINRRTLRRAAGLHADDPLDSAPPVG
jgi:hypothetical protein